MEDLMDAKDIYLEEKRSLWIKKLALEGKLISELGKPSEGIIDNTQAQTLKSITSLVARRDKLVDILKEGSVDKFRKFCTILRKSQEYLLKDLPPCLESEVQAAKVGVIVSPDKGAENGVKEVQLMPTAEKMDKEIEELALVIRPAITNNLVYLKSEKGLDFNDDMMSYLKQWDILTERDRTNIKETPAPSGKLTYLLDKLPRRTNTEVVLLVKAIIEIGQGHQLGQIGIPVSKVKAVSTDHCVAKRQSEK